MLILGEAPRYCSYLLRCWEERGLHDAGLARRHYSLQALQMGERRGFADLHALPGFIEAAPASVGDEQGRAPPALAPPDESPGP